MKTVTYRIAQTADVESIHQYETKKIFGEEAESFENKMLVWDSSYRKESLEHYLKLGWSFVAEKENQIVGFFLGQPLLFLDKQTQTLWVEYVSADSQEIFTELVDIAYRLSREKHFQKVLFSTTVQKEKLTKQFDFKPWDRQNIFLKTTK